MTISKTAMGAHEHKLADVIISIEMEMRRIGVWEQERPSARALSSQQPFCYDTLAFTQWLQWILLPRMKEILEQGKPLPVTSDIYPLAEDVFVELDADTDRLLQLIKQFDNIISGVF